jgi:dTDP-4-dehydrorhamnose 3,5-epimerase
VKITPCALPGVLLIEPAVFRDSRGFFVETYRLDTYRDGGLLDAFVQDNHSKSVRDTLRGLHLQVTRPQGKLVRVVEGEIWDVAVDVRPDSPTFGRWVAETLTGANFLQLYVPPGFAHGFCVLSDVAHVEYKCTAAYDPADEVGIAYDDPSIGIAWPLTTPLLSARDAANPRLSDLEPRLSVGAKFQSSTSRVPGAR